MLKQRIKFSYPVYHGIFEHVDGTDDCFFESRKVLKSMVGSVQEQNHNFLSKLKNAEELLDWQIDLYTAREVFRQHRDLNTAITHGNR